MALATYYGLKDSGGNIIEKDWTSLPVLNLMIQEPYGYSSAGDYCYANEDLGIRQDDYTYYYFPGMPAYNDIPKSNIGVGIYSTNRSSYRIYHRVTKNIPGFEYSLTLNLSVGSTVYGIDTTIPYTVCQYYKFTVTATTASVGGVQVGNIAIKSNGTVVSGSVSASTVGSATINVSITSESNSPTVEIIATARTSGLSDWHNKYFFNGMTRGGSTVSDSSIAFTPGVATLTATLADNSTTFVCDYGAKYALTISKGTGVSSSTVSYTRHHSTGNYVSTSTSPISLSGNGTLYVEYGSNVSASASCSSGYVFSTGNGFISQTSGVNSIYGNNSTSISGTIAALTKAASFNVTASTYAISISISDHPTWGSVYIDSSGTTSKTLVQGTTYTFYFASSRADYEAPTVATWYVNGTAISGNTYTADTLSGNVAITCTLTQNAWPVTVSAGSNGSATISGRYNKQSGAQLANTGYLRADGSDYIKVAVTPAAHYDVSQVSPSSNIAEYSQGGDYAYSLTSGANAAISFYFALAECVIKTSTNDPTLCDTSPSSTALRFDAETSVNVYCQIKEAYIGQYRVDYFTAGGAQYTAEAGGTGQ